MKREDYSRSRPLETFEYLGERFHIVRQKFEGRLWRGYTALVTDDRICIATTTAANVQLNRDVCLDKMRKLWPDDKPGMAEYIRCARLES